MELTEGEIWRPVKDYEGLYEVSNFGRVRSCDRTILKSNGGISTYSIPDSDKDNQAGTSLQNILDELNKKEKDLDKQYKATKNKADGISYKPDSDDVECYPINDEGGTGDDCFEDCDYNPERVTESDMDEVINKLSDESQALKAKIDQLSKNLAEPSTIRRVGKEQYYLMVRQLTELLNCYTILNYHNDNDLD